MKYDAKNKWGSLYEPGSNMSYPAEGVIRILKGSFPDLKMPKPNSGKILDLGCGDGRHFPLFFQSNLKGYGVEISNDICKSISSILSERKIEFNSIRSGTTDNIPFDENYFDYLLTWNSCYYMSEGSELNFSNHIKEMSRILKKNAWIIASIPKKSSFIFKDSIKSESDGFQVISNDPFGLRDGEILKCFNSQGELESEFSQEFYNFSHADIDMNWFGLNYHWHVFVAQKK
jgi:SAM-dependent methyltransferase